MLPWHFEGFATLKAKSLGSGLSAASHPHYCSVHVPVSPSAFSKGKTSWYNSKMLKTHWEVGLQVPGVAHPKALFPP
jgi:hypothetical protein